MTHTCLKARNVIPNEGSVNTSSGSSTCIVNLFPHPESENFDIVLGRNFCTTAFQDAHILLSDGHRLVFSGSPFHCAVSPNWSQVTIYNLHSFSIYPLLIPCQETPSRHVELFVPIAISNCSSIIAIHWIWYHAALLSLLIKRLQYLHLVFSQRDSYSCRLMFSDDSFCCKVQGTAPN